MMPLMGDAAAGNARRSLELFQRYYATWGAAAAFRHAGRTR